MRHEVESIEHPLFDRALMVAAALSILAIIAGQLQYSTQLKVPLFLSDKGFLVPVTDWGTLERAAGRQLSVQLGDQEVRSEVSLSKVDDGLWLIALPANGDSWTLEPSSMNGVDGAAESWLEFEGERRSVLAWMFPPGR